MSLKRPVRHPPLPPGDMAALAASWGTPLFVYRPQMAEANYREFAATLQARGLEFLAAYSYKTNFLPHLCSRLHRAGAGAEVVCAPELRLARRLRVPPQRLIINGIVKDESLLEHAAAGGALVINLETDAEAAALEALAARHGRTVPVGVRVNPNIYPYGDRPYEPWLQAYRKFGRDLDSGDALDFCLRVAGRRGLRLRGLHLHLGAQITAPAPYLRAVDAVEGLARTLYERGIGIDIVDVGGGYATRGIRRMHKDEFDRAGPEGRAALLARIQAQPDGFDIAVLADRLARWRGPGGTRPRFVFEPGRCLVAEAMVFLTRIRGIKQGPDRAWLLVDGGISHLPTVTPNEVHRLELTRSTAWS